MASELYFVGRLPHRVCIDRVTVVYSFNINVFLIKDFGPLPSNCMMFRSFVVYTPLAYPSTVVVANWGEAGGPGGWAVAGATLLYPLYLYDQIMNDVHLQDELSVCFFVQI